MLALLGVIPVGGKRYKSCFMQYPLFFVLVFLVLVLVFFLVFLFFFFFFFFFLLLLSSSSLLFLPVTQNKLLQHVVTVGVNCTTSETEAGSKFPWDRPRLRGLQPGETASVFQGNHVQRLHRVPGLFGTFDKAENSKTQYSKAVFMAI